MVLEIWYFLTNAMIQRSMGEGSYDGVSPIGLPSPSLEDGVASLLCHQCLVLVQIAGVGHSLLTASYLELQGMIQSFSVPVRSCSVSVSFPPLSSLSPSLGCYEIQGQLGNGGVAGLGDWPRSELSDGGCPGSGLCNDDHDVPGSGLGGRLEIGLLACLCSFILFLETSIMMSSGKTD